jgi:hypothetical protein
MARLDDGKLCPRLETRQVADSDIPRGCPRQDMPLAEADEGSRQLSCVARVFEMSSAVFAARSAYSVLPGKLAAL